MTKKTQVKTKVDRFERLMLRYEENQQASINAYDALHKIEERNDADLYREPRVMIGRNLGSGGGKSTPIYARSHKEIDEHRSHYQQAAQHLPAIGGSDAWNEKYDAHTRALHEAFDHDKRNQERFRKHIGWAEANALVERLAQDDRDICAAILKFSPRGVAELQQKMKAVTKLHGEGVPWGDSEKVMTVMVKDVARLTAMAVA